MCNQVSLVQHAVEGIEGVDIEILGVVNEDWDLVEPVCDNSVSARIQDSWVSSLTSIQDTNGEVHESIEGGEV